MQQTLAVTLGFHHSQSMESHQTPSGVAPLDAHSDEELVTELLRRTKSQGSRGIFLRLRVNAEPAQDCDLFFVRTTENDFDSIKMLEASAEVIRNDHPVRMIRGRHQG